MKLKLLCCDVFYREVCHLVAESPNTCDIDFLPRGLHDFGCERMVARLQEKIHASEGGGYDAICLAYGLCSNGVVGLFSKSTRLVVPRVHDCIALFLGSHSRYQERFDSHPGTWYRTTGWYERFDASKAGEVGVQERMGLTWERQTLVDQYGEENADYILATLGDPTEHYDRLAFIAMWLPCEGTFERMAQAEAVQKSWVYEKIDGSMVMLKDLIDGHWHDGFLVVEPGEAIAPSHDNTILKSTRQ